MPLTATVQPHLQQQRAVDRRLSADGVLASVGEAVYKWNLANDFLDWSEGTSELLGISDPGMLMTNRNWEALLVPGTAASRGTALAQSEQKDEGHGVPYQVQYALSGGHLRDGQDIWLEDTGRWFADPDSGRTTHAHGVVRIITERRKREERIDRMSRFDPLTGLLNRARLTVELDALFETLGEGGEPASFMLLGLEHFDLVNQVYGFEAGDAVMSEAARRIKANLRGTDIVGRFSGAKIGVVLPECDDRYMLVAGYRMLNVLRNEPIVTDCGSIALTISIGGVSIPQHARNCRAAFMAANQALEESRRNRENVVAMYRPDPERERQRLEAGVMAENIINALREGRIHLVWQPIVDAKTGEVAFHEALVRLQEHDGSSIEAGDFVAIAERLGLIRLVDHHALDLAIETMKRCSKASFSLNVSNETACDAEWLSKLAHAIHECPDIAERLIVEITESHAAESDDEAHRFIGALEDLGCRVALDDFGAGYTSFRNLKTLRFDVIKIDGQFAVDLEDNVENQIFIQSLVKLASLSGARTVVEWVEDDATATMLHEWGVDYLQGYAYGRPRKALPWPIDRPAEEEVETGTA
ncbi:MAG: EAL domain-containing protein [Pseudomonadota bacterium]